MTNTTQTAELVWAATRRTGIDFHDLDVDRPSRTGCGRSTHSAASITLTLAEATAGGMRPCPRCWPSGAGQGGSRS